jgi:biopolymer transport protein ExbB/TolQ
MILYIILIAIFLCNYFFKLSNKVDTELFKDLLRKKFNDAPNSSGNYENAERQLKALVYMSFIDTNEDNFIIQKEKNEKKKILFEKNKKNEDEFFYKDAIKTYSLNFYESNILEPYSAMVNLLPPLGFLGTVIGMVNLFIHEDGVVNASIKSTSLGTALVSTVAALFFYIVFELFKILLNNKAEKCINTALFSCDEAIKTISK